MATAPDYDVTDRFRKLLVEHLGVEEAKVTPEATLRDDLGADSLDAIELTMAVEEEFVLEINEDQELNGDMTVQDCINLIEKKRGE